MFGTDLIKGEMLASLPQLSLNFNLGLSPWYRGSVTLVWPFVLMEPQCAGVTIDRIVSAADAGEVLHQSVLSLKTEWESMMSAWLQFLKALMILH